VLAAGIAAFREYQSYSAARDSAQRLLDVPLTFHDYWRDHHRGRPAAQAEEERRAPEESWSASQEACAFAGKVVHIPGGTSASCDYYRR
jgi:hypothetical protein